MVGRTLYSLLMVTPETEGSGLDFAAAHYQPDTKQTYVTCNIKGFPGWEAEAVISPTDAGLQIDRLTIRPWGDAAPPGGITTRMLRQVRTGLIPLCGAGFEFRAARYRAGPVGQRARRPPRQG
jgi:hypothetical protein